MKSILNRRQFWVKGWSLALRWRGQSRYRLCDDPNKAGLNRHDHWQLVAPGTWKMTRWGLRAITPVTSRLIHISIEAMRRLPVVPAPIHRHPDCQYQPARVSLALPLCSHRRDSMASGCSSSAVLHRGKSAPSGFNADPCKDTGRLLMLPFHFIVSSRGYGILVDTARYATFYCGESRPKPTTTAEEMRRYCPAIHKDAGG